MVEEIIKAEGKKVSNTIRTWIFLDITIGGISTSMLATALTTALPPIMQDLSIDVNKAQWLTTAFTLCLAIITPFTGYLVSTVKTKLLYIISIVLFVIGSAICSVTNKYWLMLVGRVIQGGSNGLISSLSQVILLHIYPPEKTGTVMGWYGLSLAVSPIAAPTIAGLLVDSIGWRYIFIITGVIMFLDLLLTFVVFEDVLTVVKKKFDIVSFTLSAITFGGITLAISNVGTAKFISYDVLVPLLTGLAASVVFVILQFRIKVPFLDLRILKHYDYSISAIASFIVQLIVMGSAVIIPLYVQQVKGESATISGLVVLPGAVGNTIINPLAGKIYDKIGMRILFIIGSALLALSSFAFYFIRLHHSIWLVSGINVFRYVSLGILVMPLYTWAMRDIPKIKSSDATALHNSIRFLGVAFGTALFVSIMTKARDLSSAAKPPLERYMFGVNIAFLSMAVCALAILLLAIFCCRDKFIKKNATKKGGVDEADSSMKTIEGKDDSDVVIDVKKGDIIKESDIAETEVGDGDITEIVVDDSTVDLDGDTVIRDSIDESRATLEVSADNGKEKDN